MNSTSIPVSLAALGLLSKAAVGAEIVSVPLPVPRPDAPRAAPAAQPPAIGELPPAPTGAIPALRPRAPDAPPGIVDSACRAALEEAGVSFATETVAATRLECRPVDPIRVKAIEAETSVALASPPLLTCPMSLALSEWTRESVLPAAEALLGETPVRMHVGGGHECRSTNRRAGARFSEHATANALDIVGFTLQSGQRVEIAEDWGESSPAGRFLGRIHAEACRHFNTVLGPEADAAHADHFHLDLRPFARSGETPYCR